MRRRLIIYLLIVIQAMTFLSACSVEEGSNQDENESTNANSIKVGLIEPFEGPLSHYYGMEYSGFVLAHKLRNEALGRPVELVLANSQSDPEVSIQVAEDLIDNRGVSVLTGCYNSKMATPVAIVAQRRHVPFVAPSSTKPGITYNNDYAFRCCYTDIFQAEQIAYYAASKGFRSAAVMYDSDAYSMGNSESFARTFKEMFGEKSIVYNQGFKYPAPEDIDQDRFFIDDLREIKPLNPSMIFVPADSIDVARLIEQARSEVIGISSQFILTDTCYQDNFLKYGGENVEGALIAAPFFAGSVTGEAGISFVNAYRAEYGIEPDSVAALAFDSYNLIIDAIERAQSDKPADIRKALANTREYEGATGEITMNEHGDPMKPLFLIKVVDNTFRVVDVLEPDMEDYEDVYENNNDNGEASEVIEIVDEDIDAVVPESEEEAEAEGD